MNIAHWMGYACGWVTTADQPAVLAVPKVTVTPLVRLTFMDDVLALAGPLLLDNRRQDADDNYDHKQFDQCKPTVLVFHVGPCSYNRVQRVATRCYLRGRFQSNANAHRYSIL